MIERTKEWYGWRRCVSQAGAIFVVIPCMIRKLTQHIELRLILLRQTLKFLGISESHEYQQQETYRPRLMQTRDCGRVQRGQNRARRAEILQRRASLEID